jgi:hypothetical protein
MKVPLRLVGRSKSPTFRCAILSRISAIKHSGQRGVHSGVADALGVAVLLGEFGVGADEIARGLESFRGVVRQELIGEARGVAVVDDFAHHPTAIRATGRLRAEFRVGACIFTRLAGIGVTKTCRAWSSRDLTAGVIEGAMKRDERARPAPTVKCPKCEKLVSPPERLVPHFSGCSGLRSSVVNRPGPMYRMPDGR